MKVDRIGKAMERKTEQVKFTGGITTPGINVHKALRCLPPTGAGKDPTWVTPFSCWDTHSPRETPLTNNQTDNYNTVNTGP